MILRAEDANRDAAPLYQVQQILVQMVAKETVAHAHQEEIEGGMRECACSLVKMGHLSVRGENLVKQVKAETVAKVAHMTKGEHAHPPESRRWGGVGSQAKEPLTAVDGTGALDGEAGGVSQLREGCAAQVVDPAETAPYADVADCIRGAIGKHDGTLPLAQVVKQRAGPINVSRTPSRTTMSAARATSSG